MFLQMTFDDAVMNLVYFISNLWHLMTCLSWSLSHQVMNILRTRAYPNRAVGQTNMNEMSSRSHCLLFVNVHSKNRTNDETTMSKLVLVDLAGRFSS